MLLQVRELLLESRNGLLEAGRNDERQVALPQLPQDASVRSCYFALSAQRILQIDLLNEKPTQEVVCERLAMAQALQHAIHIARVRQVLQPRDSIAVHPVALQSGIGHADMPFGDALDLGSALGLVEAVVPRLAFLRAVRSAQAVALHYLLAALRVSLLLKILTAECAALVRAHAEFGHFLGSRGGLL